MAVSVDLLFWYCSFHGFIIAFGQDLSQLRYGGEHSFVIFSNDSKTKLIEKVDIFPTNEKVSYVLEPQEVITYHQLLEKGSRKKRQISQPESYSPPIVSGLHASQNCHGVYLRWTRPQFPLSRTKPFTISEFLYYNIYRSRQYFTSVNGMSPYASGKEYFELRKFQAGWLDRDPITNEQVWYAVTIVTKKGKEFKDAAPVKAKFIGAFGPSGRKIPLMSKNIAGRTLHHSAIFNPDRNEYFIVYEVDTNIDGQPDRIYALRLLQNGAIVGNHILDVTVKGIAGSQGRSSIAYNPIANEYVIFFQLTSSRIFGGKSLIAAVRIWTTSFKIVKQPALVLNGNENVNGKLVPIPIVNPLVIHNPSNGGYITLTEGIGVNGERSIIMQFLDSSLKNIKVLKLVPKGRSGRLALDTKRNELYIIAQLPRYAFDKASAPKLAYSIIVKKRSLSGDVLPQGEIILKAGETRLLDSSISCFYDIARDRLMVFWSDMIAGKRVTKSSQILIQGGLGSVEVFDSPQENVCAGGNLRALSVAEFPTTIGQLVVGEQLTSRGLYGPLIKEEAFQRSGKNQRAPLLVSNEAGDHILALWQEVISARQSNVFGRILKSGTHNCIGCNSPKVCKKQNTCVLPFKAKNPCSAYNGHCNHICLKSSTGAKCSCRDGFLLGSDERTCRQNEATEEMTIVLASSSTIWKTRIMKDGSLHSDHLFDGDSLVAVFVDEKENLLYWSTVDNSIIYRGQLDGTNKEIFMTNVRSDGIYINSEAGKVFWTDFLNKRIDVADTNKKNRIPLVTTEIDKPRAITSCKRHSVTYLFWSDWGSRSKIERLQLDPSLSLAANRRTLVSDQIGWPNGLTADCDRNLLYWADAQLDKIEVSDLLGNSRRKLDSITILHPFSLFIYGNSLYWSDWAGTVKRVDKQTGLNEVEVIGGVAPRGLYIFKRQTSTCNRPARPLNGNRNILNNNVGGTVTYTCNPGYNLLGSKIRKCLQSGVWSGDSPICISLPVFTMTPRNETIRQGRSLVFQCKAVGSGKIEIKWFKNGQPLETTTKILLAGSNLVFTEVSYSDEGKYTCQASNDAGTIKAVTHLRVISKIRIDCGIPKFKTRHRIFGGRNAGEGAHPWIAMFWDKSKRRPFCGGSLVAQQFVVTAAHCLEEFPKDFSNVQIKFGKVKAKRKREPNEQIRNIKKIHSHPQYNEKTYDSDIAIIELDTPVQFTDYVIPICLPHDEGDFKLVVANAHAIVIGWGATRKTKYKWSKRLKEVGVKVIDKSECKRKMTYPVTENMFCAGIGGHGDACEGDSGGPITRKNPKTKRHVLIGLVSWGLDCGNPRYYGIYVRLYNFLHWVNTIIG